MPGSTSTNMSTKEQVQESLDNLRRNIANTQDPRRKRQYGAMRDRLLRRYGHLGVR